MQNFVFDDIPLKMSSKVTLSSFNLKLFKFKYINELQFLNILCISFTLPALKFDKSK